MKIRDTRSVASRRSAGATTAARYNAFAPHDDTHATEPGHASERMTALQAHIDESPRILAQRVALQPVVVDALRRSEAGSQARSQSPAQRKLLVAPDKRRPLVLDAMTQSSNTEFYKLMFIDPDFTLKITYGGVAKELGQMGETTGSATSLNEQREPVETDLKKKTNATALHNRVTDIGTHADLIASSLSQEVNVLIYDAYAKEEGGTRKEIPLSESSKLATLIHELELHVVPAYRLIIASKLEAIQRRKVQGEGGNNTELLMLRQEITEMLSQDEHADPYRIVKMMTTVYRMASKMGMGPGMALLNDVRRDIYTLPGFTKPQMVELEERGKQASQK